MYNTIIKNIDIVNVVFAIVATVMLLINENAYLLSCTILVTTFALLVTKYRFNRLFTFLTYAGSAFFFAYLYGETITNVATASNYLLIIIAIASVIGLIASFVKLGSSTLSFVWLIMHLLVFITAFQMTNHTSFLQAFWSNNAQLYTISQYYPYLLAGFLIGVFLEKYQVAIKRDRRED